MENNTPLRVNSIINTKRIIVKIGSNTLTHESGTLNFRRIEELAMVLCDLAGSGRDVILVSSGAVSAGVSKLGLDKKPSDISGKQACAAVGQANLVNIYEHFFALYGRNVAQVLLTRDVINEPQRRRHAHNTFEALLSYGCIPIVNENDTIADDELQFSGNDILSAFVAVLTKADLLVNLSDVNGLYDKNPSKYADAKLITHVPELTDEILACAGGAGSERGTGGMAAKLEAVAIAAAASIPTVVANGSEPKTLYAIMEGEVNGTYFGEI